MTSGRPPTDPIVRFWKFVDKRGENECWLWLGAKQRGGHGAFRIETGVMTQAHRFAYELAYGYTHLQVNHKRECNNSSCVNPKHLYAGTPQQNSMDANMTGRFNGKGNSKLNREQAEKIKELTVEGTSVSKLATQFHVSRMTIHRIVKGTTWK